VQRKRGGGAIKAERSLRSEIAERNKPGGKKEVETLFRRNFWGGRVSFVREEEQIKRPMAIFRGGTRDFW